MLRPFLLLATLLFLTATSASQDKKQPAKIDPPRILHSMPLVVKKGEKQKLTLRGKGLATVKEIKIVGVDDVTAKVLAGKAVAVPNNYPGERIGDSEVGVEFQLPATARAGEVKLVAVGPGGESTPYTLLLRDELSVVLEKEPNEGFDQAQQVTVPCAIEGVVQSERDVDVFKFAGKKGEKLRIEIQAARYGSPLDAMLTLYDADRRVVDSTSETSPDPIVNVTLPRDGPYYVSVMDANDLGGANFGYRLVVKKGKAE